eukprot:Skav234802  [mRNA]  locus=scaffold69:330573:338076:+ [translate_table: standard]
MTTRGCTTADFQKIAEFLDRCCKIALKVGPGGPRCQHVSIATTALLQRQPGIAAPTFPGEAVPGALEQLWIAGWERAIRSQGYAMDSTGHSMTLEELSALGLDLEVRKERSLRKTQWRNERREEKEYILQSCPDVPGWCTLAASVDGVV